MKLNFAKLLAALGILLLAAGGYALLRSRDGTGEQALRTVRLERGALQAVVAASGTLNAVTTVQVGSQISTRRTARSPWRARGSPRSGPRSAA